MSTACIGDTCGHIVALQALEERTALGKRVSSTVLAIAAGAALSYLHLLPPASPTYDVVWSALMPLGAALLLLQSPVSFGRPAAAEPTPNLSPADAECSGVAEMSESSHGAQRSRDGTGVRTAHVACASAPPLGQALAAFALATAGSVAGTLAAWALTAHWLRDASGAAVAAALCASYVGGSLNFAAVIQARPARAPLGSGLPCTHRPEC